MPGLLVLVATGCAPTGSADPELEICDRVATVVTALYEPTTPTREQQTWADADVVQLIDGGPLHVPSESWPNNSVFLLQLGVDGVSEWSTVYVEIDVWSDLYEVPFASGAWAYDRKSDCSLQRDGEIETIRVHSGLSACDDLWRVDGTPVHVEVSLHDSGPLGEGVSQEFELVAAAVPSERCPGESG